MLRLTTALAIVFAIVAVGWAVPLKTERSFVPEFNPDLFEGDIMGIDPKDKESRNAIVNERRLWPDGIIYYEIAPNQFTQRELDIINEAIRIYETETCIRFVRWTDQDHRIVIQKTGGGCYSYIGMQITASQPISLDAGCFGGGLPGTPLHEMMHALGFYHEQSRTDRDDYVIINWDNIQPGYESNFDKYGPDQLQTLGIPYDYGSVMHYPPYGFAIDPTIPTIIPTPDPSVEIGQRRGFSQYDIDELNILYKCNAKKQAVGPKF